MTNWQQEVYLIADELRGMANLTKQFADTVYDHERADRMLELAARIAALPGEHSLDETRAIFLKEPWLRISPVVGVEAAVFNPQGELLLAQRHDNSHWVVPGGIAEIGQTPTEAALRELWEETGLRGRARRLLGIFDGRLWGTRATAHIVHLVYLIECEHLEPVPGIEMTAARFFPADRLPSLLQPGHTERIPKIFELARSEECYFDPASAELLDLPLHQRPQESAS